MDVFRVADEDYAMLENAKESDVAECSGEFFSKIQSGQIEVVSNDGKSVEGFQGNFLVQGVAGNSWNCF